MASAAPDDRRKSLLAMERYLDAADNFGKGETLSFSACAFPRHTLSLKTEKSFGSAIRCNQMAALVRLQVLGAGETRLLGLSEEEAWRAALSQLFRRGGGGCGVQAGQGGAVVRESDFTARFSAGTRLTLRTSGSASTPPTPVLAPRHPVPPERGGGGAKGREALAAALSLQGQAAAAAAVPAAGSGRLSPPLCRECTAPPSSERFSVCVVCRVKHRVKPPLFCLLFREKERAKIWSGGRGGWGKGHSQPSPPSTPLQPLSPLRGGSQSCPQCGTRG